MNHLFLLLLILFISLKAQAQKTFEGLIKFSTHISTSELAPQNLEEVLKAKYGDSLVMNYSANGNFKRIHKNNSELSHDTQLYLADKGKIYFISNNQVLDSLDVTVNSLKLIEKKKVDNEIIIGLYCKCYEYKATSIYNQNVILTYCFSKNTPKINAKLYSIHHDFFLDTFYKMSKRPYLKFSIETDEFKIMYIASEIITKHLNQDFFELK